MDPGRAANVHVRADGSPGWVFALQFRDWLRADPGLPWRAWSLQAGAAAGVPSTEEYAEAMEPWLAVAYPGSGWPRTGWTDRAE